MPIGPYVVVKAFLPYATVFLSVGMCRMLFNSHESCYAVWVTTTKLLKSFAPLLFLRSDLLLRLHGLMLKWLVFHAPERIFAVPH